MQMKKNIWLCIPIKSGLLILCFLFSNHLIFSQQIEWIKQINYIWNTLYADESPVLNIETDSAGNVYAAGKCRIPYFNGYASDYHRGFFLEKRDSNGNILWMDTVVQQADLVSLAFDGSNLYVTGEFYSKSISIGNTVLYKPQDSLNSSFFIKYNLQGNIIWVKQDIYKYKLYKLKYYNNAFYSYGNVYYFSKFDMSGNLIWSVKTAKYGVEDLAISDSNNIYIKTGSGPSYDPDSIKKYDSNGNLLWAIDFPGYGGGFTADKKGNCYISGVYTSGNNYIAKLDSTGQYLWFKQNFPHGAGEGYLGADSEQDYFYVGGGDNNYKGWLDIYDSSGNYLRGVQIGDYIINPKGGKCIVRVGQTFYVGGYKIGQYPIGFVAKITDPNFSLNTNENQTENNSSLNVYPNPT